MKRKKFRLEILEEGRLTKSEANNLYGGATDCKAFICTVNEIACFKYTECNGHTKMYNFCVAPNTLPYEICFDFQNWQVCKDANFCS